MAIGTQGSENNDFTLDKILNNKFIKIILKYVYINVFLVYFTFI